MDDDFMSACFEDNVEGTELSQMKYEALAKRVRYFKEDPKGVEKMGKVMEEIRMEERREVARSFLALGKLSHEEIAKCAKLSIEEVDELAKEKVKDFSKVS